MIISRTPLRMSYVGGGSDIAAFYRRFGGAVVSAAINQFVYVTVSPKFDRHIRLSYSRTENVETVAELQHPIVRETLEFLGIEGGIEITSVADIPSHGTGLGSSSAFTVGLLNALHAHRREFASAEQLAQEACGIEIDRCGEPIGKQDQYASAFGGLNFIEFHEDDSVSVDPIIALPETIRVLGEHTLVLYTGLGRSASAILAQQQSDVASDARKQAAQREMVGLAFELKRTLERNRLDTFGEILHANWELKKSLSGGISTPEIDEWYAEARRLGAAGGKLLGAGAGGFLMFYAPPELHEAIATRLALRQVDFRTEREGSKIIFVH